VGASAVLCGFSLQSPRDGPEDISHRCHWAKLSDMMLCTVTRD
jgi:hypothetical protein